MITRLILSTSLLWFFGNASVELLVAQSVDSLKPLNSAPILVRPIRDLTISEGVPFKFNLQSTGSVFFGYDVGGSDLSVTGNYFASQVSFPQPWKNVLFSGNTVTVRDWNVVALSMPIAPSDQYIWDCNRYYCSVNRPFVHQKPQTWDQWLETTGFDRRSHLVPRDPPASVFVRANLYRPGRGHLIIYNWDRSDSVDVDLSPIVRIGASYKIYNVLDLHGQPALRGLFDGGKVSLPISTVPFPSPIGQRTRAPLVMDQEFSTFVVISDAESLPISGNSHFVSTLGTTEGNGSWLNPWDLNTALLHPESVQPGDTIWLRGGTYRGEFTSKLSGRTGAPIVVREQPGEEVKIDLYNKATKVGSTFSIAGQHTWYRGFELFSSDPSSRWTNETGSWPASIARGGFVVQGDHIKLINLEIHDLRQGLGFWSTGIGGEAYGLIIYNNGWISSDRNHGHGIYTQNAGETRRLVDNIIFSQFRNGISVYGSSEASLKDFHIEGNVLFANGGAGGEGYSSAFQLLVGGGSEAENITVTNNFTYDLPHHFRDDDYSDTLNFSAQQVDGSPLPAWLTFVENEGYFHGTPTSDDVGTIAIRVTAHDSSNAKATDTFHLRITRQRLSPS